MIGKRGGPTPKLCPRGALDVRPAACSVRYRVADADAQGKGCIIRENGMFSFGIMDAECFLPKESKCPVLSGSAPCLGLA